MLIKKYLTILLAVLTMTASLAFPVVANAQSNAQSERTRAKVQTLSASHEQQVEVKFRDKTKLKGRITKVEPMSFTLSDSKTGTSQTIAYSEVDSVAKAGDGISTKTWLIIGGVAAGAVTTWLIVKPAVCDGGAQTRGIC